MSNLKMLKKALCIGTLVLGVLLLLQMIFGGLNVVRDFVFNEQFIPNNQDMCILIKVMILIILIVVLLLNITVISCVFEDKDYR